MRGYFSKFSLRALLLQRNLCTSQFSSKQKQKKGSNFLGPMFPILRLTFLELSCNFGETEFLVFSQLNGSSGPMWLVFWKNSSLSWSLNEKIVGLTCYKLIPKSDHGHEEPKPIDWPTINMSVIKFPFIHMLNRKKGVAKFPPFKLHFTAKKNRGTVQLLMD